MEYLLWCDESVKKGKYFSNFYGGVLISSKDLPNVTVRLNNIKKNNNLFNEVKWQKVTANYLQKYIAIIDEFFDLVKAGQIKVRIMFTHNVFIARSLSIYQREHEYFILYYMFIKFAFGLAYSNDSSEDLNLRLYFDKMADNETKRDLFKSYIHNLQNIESFKKARIKINKDDITEVDSRKHTIMQCLDVVLGAMAFRLNDLHKQKDPQTGRRGKKTIAKEKLYKYILSRIIESHKNFNIGITTGLRNDIKNLWNDQYRHWKLSPKDPIVDLSKAKK